MRVADHLRLGAWLNPGWDEELARRRMGQVGLDEPVASLDPLARREFLRGLMAVSSLDSLRPENLPGQSGAWLLFSETINAAGQPVTATSAACATPPVVTGTETAIYLALHCP
jgi:hypothetical protein